MPSLERTVNESVVCAELEEEAVLLHVEAGVYFGLDEVGLRIWNLLVAGTTETELFDRLLAEYDVEPDQLRSDIGEFLDDLEAEVQAGKLGVPRFQQFDDPQAGGIGQRRERVHLRSPPIAWANSSSLGSQKPK